MPILLQKSQMAYAARAAFSSKQYRQKIVHRSSSMMAASALTLIKDTIDELCVELQQGHDGFRSAASETTFRCNAEIRYDASRRSHAGACTSDAVGVMDQPKV